MLPYMELFRFLGNHAAADDPEYRMELRDHIVALWIEYQLDSFQPVTPAAFVEFLQVRLGADMTPRLKSQLVHTLRRNEIFIFVQPPEPDRDRAYYRRHRPSKARGSRDPPE